MYLDVIMFKVSSSEGCKPPANFMIWPSLQYCPKVQYFLFTDLNADRRQNMGRLEMAILKPRCTIMYIRVSIPFITTLKIAF